MHCFFQWFRLSFNTFNDFALALTLLIHYNLFMLYYTSIRLFNTTISLETKGEQLHFSSEYKDFLHIITNPNQPL